jgi:hypothetical protein
MKPLDDKGGSLEADPCMDKVEREICAWEYDAGDSSVGVNAAWVCIACGNVDINREPPSHDDDIR